MGAAGNPTALPGWHWHIAAVACLALLGAKLWLISRININWDEFNFLSHVFESTRGELKLLLQGAFVHLFRWLPMLDGDEVDLVLAGRFVMWALLALTAFLVWRLACTWVSKPIALTAVVCYLSTLPMLLHGASFRYDSLIVPLIVASAWLVTRADTKPRAMHIAALLFGVAGVLSIKSLLFAPMLAALVVVRLPDAPSRPVMVTAIQLVKFGALAMITAALLLWLHSLTLAHDSLAADGYARTALTTMVLDVPFLPRGPVFGEMWQADAVIWLLLAAGFVLAALQARYRSACVLLLALSPLLFYRNAWPYFYVVMLAPACVFAAIAAESAARFLSSRSQARAAALVVATFSLAFAGRGLSHAAYLRDDQQQIQRAVVAAVHDVFPDPVPYIDHSGMIASFPKANFFMSTWGVTRYQEGGRGFMDEAIARSQPRFLLLNHWRLEWRGRGAEILLPRDREVLDRYYLPYWGPIYVAGAAFDLTTRPEMVAALPFAGSYRLESPGPVVIDGVMRQPGDVIEFSHMNPVVARASAETPLRGRLVTAAARETRLLNNDFPLLQTSEGIYQRL